MFKLILQACGNVDHEENPYENIVNGKIVQENHIICNSIKECQKATRNYIEQNNLGSGNFLGGFTFDEYDNQVGYISYNAKYWKKGSKYYIKFGFYKRVIIC